MIAFDNSYARLPERFYTRQPPTPVAAPALIKVNTGLADRLGIDPAEIETSEMIAALAGNGLPEGAEPLAQAYAGHQFGGWSPQLGDGRALLLGEIVAPDGARFDIQLKGSGPTPYSRRGDGRAPLGPVLREYIVSEAMAALGVPTTRSLAAVATGERVYREIIEPGAVLTRVASSHIRVGTFQFFAAREDEEALRLLADHAIARHYPEAAEDEDPYAALLTAVADRQARLIARWMSLGFIHGVMNTDNMTISGETIDYGPCAFMDAYHPARVFSSIDTGGRYAYGNQPRIAQWNLACLAQCLMPLMAGDDAAQLAAAQTAIDGFPEVYHKAWLDEFRAKTGLVADPEDPDLAEQDSALLQKLLTAMAEAGADFTLTFRGLADETARDLFADPAGFESWAKDWQARGGGYSPALANTNPAIIPRNHRVEAAIAAALDGDFSLFEELLAATARPFDPSPQHTAYRDPPTTTEIVHQTFCGT
ncbi:MAG: YdiU family protein [Pseudomonadota bacterium]